MNYNNSRGYGSNPYQFKNRGSDLESMMYLFLNIIEMKVKEPQGCRLKKKKYKKLRVNVQNLNVY